MTLEEALKVVEHAYVHNESSTSLPYAAYELARVVRRAQRLREDGRPHERTTAHVIIEGHMVT
jgi:hypothetical protein